MGSIFKHLLFRWQNIGKHSWMLHVEGIIVPSAQVQLIQRKKLENSMNLQAF